MKERDTAIDFVKFVALFFVLNSHMEMSYVGGAKSLATGGAIGDSLFFFASGFTLFLGKDLDFANWYKRRINRIYPSLIAVAIIGAAVFSIDDSFVDVFLAKRYWFIQCIFVLYPFLYLAKRYVTKHIPLLCILTLIVMIVFAFVFKGEELFWGLGHYRWSVFLLFMLIGAIIGKEREKIKALNFWVALALFVLSVAAWYASAALLIKTVWQVLTIFPMMGVVVFAYVLGRSKPIETIMGTRVIGRIIISIGALGLESYLIQKMFITDKWNGFFPLNIPLIMICVVIASYFAKVISNLIIQIFDSQPLNWKKLFVLY